MNPNLITSATNDLPPPADHVFVDFENVQSVDFAVIGKKGVSFTFLLGAKQTKMNTALVEKFLEHAAAIQMVRLTSSGKNALDFALAYYLGRAVLADPTASFHVVSKDTGFDSLLEHLRSRHVRVRRHNDFTTLPFCSPPKNIPTPPPDLLPRVLEYLRKNTTSRPKRRKTLASHLLAFLGKAATESEVSALIERLHKNGNLSLSEKGAVTYSL